MPRAVSRLALGVDPQLDSYLLVCSSVCGTWTSPSGFPPTSVLDRSLTPSTSRSVPRRLEADEATQGGPALVPVHLVSFCFVTARIPDEVNQINHVFAHNHAIRYDLFIC